MKFKGRVWKFGDDIDTDLIIAGKHLTTTDPHQLTKIVFETVKPKFAADARKGDIIIAGKNFGCGSSREHAPAAIRASGIDVIVAESFARIFFRNAINIGLPAIECSDVAEEIEEGDVIEVDIENGTVTLPSGKVLKFNPIPENVMKILELGGLANKVKEELRSNTG
jgi:3-isopropylmalate/(R)-2-methylmalate dehydratase small subunit